jgi:hypothetical protein
LPVAKEAYRTAKWVDEEAEREFTLKVPLVARPEPATTGEEVLTLGVTKDVNIQLVTVTEPVTTGEDVPTRGATQYVDTPLDTHQEPADIGEDKPTRDAAQGEPAYCNVEPVTTGEFGAPVRHCGTGIINHEACRNRTMLMLIPVILLTRNLETLRNRKISTRFMIFTSSMACMEAYGTRIKETESLIS